jgi:hypothetical protein
MNDIDQTALEIARAFIPVDVVGQQRANLQVAIIEAIKKHANPKTLADVQPGGRVRLEQEPRDHRWDDVGERCLDCGDKDWMGGPCSGPRTTAATGPWLSITNAPNDGRPHIRGLWETSRIDGKPESREWRQYIGLINDGGEFVDPEHGETFGWAADQFEAWMPAADAPGAALSAQPSPGGQDVLASELLAHAEGLERMAAGDRETGESIEQAIENGEGYTPDEPQDVAAGLQHDATKAEETANLLRNAAAALAARQPVGQEPLWCLHVLGMDDVHPAPSKAHAEKAAAWHNEQFKDQAARLGISIEAKVVPWPHSAESHAAGVAEFIPQWLIPQWQLDALEANAAPPAQAVDLADFKALYRAYVRMLESGRDRIIDLGGTCDPVDVMEANDVDLQAARRVIDGNAQAVDLRPLTDLVNEWSHLADQMQAVRPQGSHTLRGYADQLKRRIALLDSQAVGK